MASTSSTSRNSTMTDIAGISLIVDKHGDEPARVLTFYKNKSDVILIGRRSSTSTRTTDDEHDRALFRCPVISRRHAKITFTQYGNVYLSDLSSHHGTHILRPGESVPKIVPSEYPTVLADGDTLTFGKPVGKDDSLVHPVTARVHLLFSIPSTSTSPTQSSSTPVQPTTSAAAPAVVRTGSSGRYGMYTPAMTSSGSDSSSEDDIEEIPPPQQLPPCSSFAGMPWGWPMNSFQHHPYQPPHMQHPHHMHRADPMQVGRSGRLNLLRRILPRLGSVEEIASHRGSNRMSPISISSDSRSSSEVVEVSREERVQESFGLDTNATSEAQPRADSLDEDAGEDMDLESEADFQGNKDWNLDAAINVAIEVPNNSVSVIIASSRICTPEPSSPVQEEQESESSDSDMYATPPPHDNVAVDVGRDSPLKFSFLDEDFDFPEVPQAQVEAQFDARVESLKSKLADLEERMHVPEPVFFDFTRFNAPEPASQPAPAPVEKAPEQEPEAASTTEMMSTLKGMFEALEDLRKKAEVDMAKELDALRAARVEAEAAVATARQAAFSSEAQESAPANEASASLKRKRDEVEREDDDTPSTVAPPLTAASCQAVMDKLAAEPPRKRKRSEPSARVAVAKRIAVGVAKTTAIAAVGAVAAWSALAFS